MKKMIFFLLIFVLPGCSLEPEIEISGVEDGEIYVNDRVITINESAAGDYSMTLNGEAIQNNHRLEKNNVYKLHIEASRFWNEKDKTITFEIDDQPPLEPMLLNPKEIYFKEATFRLIKEENIKYSVFVDGKPYNLKQPYTKEGRHTIEIIAKKDNGLTSARNHSFTIDNTTYTKEVYQAFKKLALRTGDENAFHSTRKWYGEIPVYVHGKPTRTDRQVLNAKFESINNLLPVDFNIKRDQETKKNKKSLNIYFVPTSKFDEYGFKGDVKTGNKIILGFTSIMKTNMGKITKAKIVIGTNRPQSERNSTIFHEIMHAVGLPGHLENNPKSILYPMNNKITKLSDFDKQIIKLLYREDVEVFMDEEELDRLLKPRIKG